jgi:hypothetical protein
LQRTVTTLRNDGPRCLHRDGTRTTPLTPVQDTVNHTDDELAMIEWLAGFTPPFDTYRRY